MARYFGYTETGRSNSIIHSQIMSLFIDKWSIENPGLHCYVFGDQLSFHKNIETIINCYKNNIYLWYFPVNCSHFLQPLDNVCFGLFKKLIYKKISLINLNTFFDNSSHRNSILNIIIESEQRSFTKKIIKKSFQQTGIFPFDKKIIIQNSETFLGEKTIVKDNNIKLLDDSIVKSLNNSFNQELNQNLNIENKKIQIKKNELYSPTKIIGNHNLITSMKENKKKRKIKEKEEINIIQRIICQAKKCDRKFYGGQKWKKCSKCSSMFCPFHLDSLEEHLILCVDSIVE